MSVSEVITAWDAGHLHAYVSRVNNPVPLAYHSQQDQALDDFLMQGFPTRNNEAWKYSPLTRLSQRDYALPTKRVASSIDFAKIASLKVSGTLAVVFVDGYLFPECSDLAAIQEQVEVCFDGTVPVSDYTHFFDQVKQSSDPLVQLNAGLLTHFMTLRVKPGVVVETPIQLLHYFTGSSVDVMHHTALRIELGESSSLSLLQEGVSQEEVTCLHNHVTDIALSANANLHHYELQRYADTVTYVTQTRVIQARDSHWLHCAAQLGSGFSRNALTTDLMDQAATCSLIGFSHVTGQQHRDTHLLINHAASHTTSRQFFRNLIDDRGVAIFSGKAQVASGIGAISADQTNNNLLLSPHAKAFIRPQLEIDADDVKCSHGATIGQLDPEAIFYCQSRGMPRQLAYTLLLQSYVEALLVDVPAGLCLDWLRHSLMSQLDDNALLSGGCE